MLPGTSEAETRVDHGLEDIASHYSTAFPSADVSGFRAHLAVVRTGNRLAQSVAQFLAGNFGINSARYSLLRALYFTEEKRLPQSEVAKAMNVTSPNVTQLIDALEREGLVERVVSETDRRVTLAQLTPDGTAKCSELVPAMARFMQETSGDLTQDEMVQLVDLLNKFRNHLVEMNLEA
jgi:DNA-binding MarR family transcriptional regulator